MSDRPIQADEDLVQLGVTIARNCCGRAYHADMAGRHQHQGGSDAAHEAVKPHKKILRARILELLRTRGTLTLYEAAESMRITVNSLSGRFTELRTSGDIERTGEFRRNLAGRSCAVYRRRSKPVEPEPPATITGQYELLEVPRA